MKTSLLRFLLLLLFLGALGVSFQATSSLPGSINLGDRSFQDMNKLGLPEAQVVLGAAVLDDILSLIILAVVTGILTTGLRQYPVRRHRTFPEGPDKSAFPANRLPGGVEVHRP